MSDISHKSLRTEDPSSFQNFTRLDETMFDELLAGISDIIKRQDTVMRQAISPRERLVSFSFVKT